MANDLVELRAEMTAMRALLTTIAPMVFRKEGLTADNIVSFAAGLSEQCQKAQVEGADQDFIQQLRDLNSKTVTDLFGSVAATMRT